MGGRGLARESMGGHGSAWRGRGPAVSLIAAKVKLAGKGGTMGNRRLGRWNAPTCDMSHA